MDENQSPVKQLAKLAATKGVPPFILASNIYDPAYRSVKLWKENGFIFVETMCDDPDYEQTMTFLYRYDADKVLLRIDATFGGRTTVYYDRAAEIKQLVQKVVEERHRTTVVETAAAVAR